MTIKKVDNCPSQCKISSNFVKSKPNKIRDGFYFLLYLIRGEGVLLTEHSFVFSIGDGGGCIIVSYIGDSRRQSVVRDCLLIIRDGETIYLMMMSLKILYVPRETLGKTFVRYVPRETL